MSSNGALTSVYTPPGNRRDERLRVLFDELSELCGQRNAIDGQIVDIVAEIDHDELWGSTGARSVAGLVAWKTGSTTGHAAAITAIAHRVEEFPQCTQALRDGQLSLDQIGVIAAHAGKGSDAHYAQLASVATVTQLRTAVKLEPRPDTDPKPGPRPGIHKTGADDYDNWRITLPHIESAKFAAALASHRDALFAQWTRDHDGRQPDDEQRRGQAPDNEAPVPTNLDAFLRLIEHGWDTEATARPHGQHTTVVVHLDLATKIANLHLGPLLPDADRQYLTCDATCEVWFHRDGTLIGAGHRTRTINRRLRRALEHRDHTCV
ncbi:13E12 repeat family protein, partial [Mycolicibacterium insubricum]